MNVILGIDTAWTLTEPSGVALAVGNANDWRCLCVAPSYDSFIACASGDHINWHADAFSGSAPDVTRLISAARSIAGVDPTLVAVDMPIANTHFSGRRRADQAISEAFGGRGCSTHSPNATRPGPLGTKLTVDLSKAGYPLATCTDSASPSRPRTIEVFPHPALLVLLNRSYRVPYKVGKSSKYWKGTDVSERIAKLLAKFAQIEGALRRVFGETHIDLPAPTDVRSLSYLKRYEDALDAMVCAWVGAEYIARTVDGYGDNTAAIWVPISRSAV